jgi:hypothetical protein
MQHTLFTLLTNKKGRHARDIRASLDREFIAGAPWFNVVQGKNHGRQRLIILLNR